MIKKKFLISLVLDSSFLMEVYEKHFRDNLEKLQLALCQFGVDQKLNPEDILISCTLSSEFPYTSNFTSVTNFDKKFYKQSGTKMNNFFKAFDEATNQISYTKKKFEAQNYEVKSLLLTFMHKGNFFVNYKNENYYLNKSSLLTNKDKLIKNNVNLALVEFGRGSNNIAGKLLNINSNVYKEINDDYAPFDKVWDTFIKCLLNYYTSDNTLTDNFFK